MLHLIGACAIVALSATAQHQTWIVDAKDGPGADFASLPPAIEAAADGDAIVVRAGVYRGGPLRIAGKGLRILTAAGERAIVFGAHEVSDLNAAQSVVIRGLDLRGDDGAPVLRVANCAGWVHLDEITINPNHPADRARAIEANAVALLSIQRSSIRSTIRVVDSQLQVSGSALRGTDAGLAELWSTEARPALDLESSTATLAATDARGGDGIARVDDHSEQPPAAGIVLARSLAKVVGDSDTVIAAGADPHPTGAFVSAIDGRKEGETFISTRVTLSPTNNAPEISGWFAPCPLPSLEAGIESEGESSNKLSGHLVSPPDELLVLFGGAPSIPVATLLGPLCVEQPLLLSTHTQGPEGRLSFTVRIPRLPTLVRMPIALQAIAVGVDHVGLTNAVVTTLFP